MESPKYTQFFAGDHGGTFLDCMNTARTCKAQRMEFRPPGLTTVAFLRLDDLWPLDLACQRLATARPTFHTFDKRPHMTMQGILGTRQPSLTSAQRRQVALVTGEAMQQAFAGAKPLEVNLTSIELGRTNGESDGTLVWLAPQAHNVDLVRRIEEFGSSLASMLIQIAPDLTLPPRQPGGSWLTLGYFDESADFPIDRGLAEALDELQHFTARVWIDQVALVEFGYKALLDGRVLSVARLQAALAGRCGMKPKPRVLARSLWPSFRGWSFLFDNPGDSLRPFHEVSLMSCQPWIDSALTLYRAFGDALEAIGLHTPTNPYSFHKVESGSGHVTAMDGHNEENMDQLNEETQALVAGVLRDLPFRFHPLPPECINPNGFAGVISAGQPLRLEFSHLSLWGNRILVARLRAADPESADVLRAVEDRRRELDAQFVFQGRRPLGDYTPHCTLAYAVDETAGATAALLIDSWTATFKEITAGKTIEFTSISAYGFADMVTFVKRPESGGVA